MGATVILTGVSPGIAQTMVTVGIELDHRKELPVATPPIGAGFVRPRIIILPMLSTAEAAAVPL